MSEGARPVFVVAVAGLLVIVVLPLLFVLLQAIFPAIGRGSLADPFGRTWATLSDPALLRYTANTLLLGVSVVVGSALIGIPLGMLRALTRVPGAAFWDVVFLIPFMIPPYIAALGWILTLQRRGYLDQLAGIDGSPLIFSFWGVVFVMTMNVFPVVYFAVSRTMMAVGSRFADIGRVSGGSPAVCFWRITLPLSTPGIAASLLLVFAMAIEEFGTPAALASRTGFHVLVTAIERNLSDYPINLAAAATLSVILVGLAIGAYTIQARIVAGRSYATVTGKAGDLAARPLGAWTLPVLVLFASFAVTATFGPLFAILATAFSSTLSGGLALDNLSLRHFQAIFADQAGARRAILNSLGLGLAAAAITGFLGFAIAYSVVRTETRGRRLLDVLSLLPNTIPGVVVAVGLILAWNQSFWPVTPYNTAFILLLAYCCLLLPYPVRYADAAFRQLGPSVEAAARVAGASLPTTLRRILLPLIWPSMLTAGLLVFAVASRELVASILLAPAGMQTVAVFIWRQFEQGSVGLGMAMSAVAIAITTTIPLVVALRTRRHGMLG
jgi:iron(III) transport system permease protein